MRLLDDKASVSVYLPNTFRQLLREGAVYEVSEFEITRCNNHFKFCDSNLAIQFNDLTKFIEVPAVPNPIPTEKFRLHKFEELMTLANTNVQLPEIIGEVSNIRTIYNDKSQTTQRVMVYIKIDNYTTVFLSVLTALLNSSTTDLKLVSAGQQ
ncbi:hypothetical protein F2Q69_00041282 [Brassica cretica]|uniref:DUF223 domain-containing protein n=1 Tax=Brassica cretica TaxID=69181 RepID=A0A8S9N9C6_BRACR|nr:hypothetical protein F2Q69_00041282 [Brassica cretica]